MTAGSLWIRIGATCAAALALLLVATPADPAPLWSTPDGALVGLVAGVALFHAVARAPLPLPPTLVAVLVLAAAAEEVIWRWFVLGELLAPAGTAAALAASTCGFGLVHPGRRLLHLATGLTFGAVYVVTGGLLAAWGAHAAYNVSVAAASRRTRPVAG